nr:aromatic-ring-hydroxylating dioxygenase subunit beta [Candidatus Frankia alpina]
MTATAMSATAMTATATSRRIGPAVADLRAVTRAQIEDFLYAEAELLDAWDLDTWVTLFTDDAHYVIPLQRRPGRRPDARPGSRRRRRAAPAIADRAAQQPPGTPGVPAFRDQPPGLQRASTAGHG